MKAILLLLCLLSGSVWADKASTFIPDKAHALLPLVVSEIDKAGAEFDAAILASSIEQESCVSLTHSRCWSTTSEYKTRWKNKRLREWGAGLSMLTATWHSDGRVRFDTLTRLRNTYPDQLKGLSWEKIGKQPRLQILAGILLKMEAWDAYKHVGPCNATAMMLSAYNQGKGGVNKDRRLCGLKKGCNPNIWWGNVEQVKRVGFATKTLYGTSRTAWNVNRTHVKNVLKVRLKKYRAVLYPP